MKKEILENNFYIIQSNLKNIIEDIKEIKEKLDIKEEKYHMQYNITINQKDELDLKKIEKYVTENIKKRLDLK